MNKLKVWTPQGVLGYDQFMASDVTPPTGPAILDLTGLPEPVVKRIKQLVESLREGVPSHAPSGAADQPPTLRGRFASLNLTVPKEDLDEAQREAWQDFPRDFPAQASHD